MGKIIIDNRSEKLSDSDALLFVQAVIGKGRVSNFGKQHCYVSVWEQYSQEFEVHVVTDLNKKSDRFIIYTRDKESKNVLELSGYQQGRKICCSRSLL